MTAYTRAAALLLIALLAAPAMAIDYQTVIVSGRPDGDLFGPELGPGIDWDNAAVEKFLLNGAGQVLFVNELDDAQPNNIDRGLWRWTAGSKQLYLREGSPLGPGLGNVSNLSTALGNFADDGASYHSVFESGINPTHFAFSADGTFSVVSRPGSPVPAPLGFSRTTEEEVGADINPAFPSLFPDGSLIDGARIVGPGVSTANDGVLWQGTLDGFSVIINEGQQAPGYAAGASIQTQPASSSTGERAEFSGNNTSHWSSGSYQTFASYVEEAGSTIDRAVWLLESGSLSLIANLSTPTGTAEPFFDFRDLKVNSAGDVGMANPLSSGGRWVIHRAQVGNSGLGLLAGPGVNAPGTVVTFADHDDPEFILTESGALAFDFGLSGANITDGNDVGIWINDDAGTRLAVREGDAVSNQPGANIGTLTDYAMNDGQLLVGLSSLVGAVSAGVDDQALWSVDPSGNLEIKLRSGDSFDVNPGGAPDVRTIESFSMDGYFDRLGAVRAHFENSTLNNSGQLLLGISFTNGTDGLFLINVTPIPEPSAAILVLMGAVTFSVHRPRRLPNIKS